MAENAKNNSQRVWKRHKADVGVIVLLRKMRLLEFGKPSYIELGPAIDISRGGLAVQYIDSKERAAECEEMAISIPAEEVTIGPIPFRTVKESTVAQLPDGRAIKQRSIQFGELTPKMIHQIESVIRRLSTEA